jgi:hypothetical protein
VLSLQKPASAAGVGAEAQAQAPDSDVLRSRFVGANPEPQVIGLDALAGTSNYFIGSDPSQWHTGIATYGRVEYQNLYPGVDLVYYGDQRQLEYDYVVAPEADPGVIKLAIDGAESMALDGQGDLVLHASGGDVLEHAPVVYQEVGGIRQPVSGRFVLGGDGQVGFAVGAYDPSLPLVIDPVLSYSTYLGGPGTGGLGITVDAAGNAYVTGGANSAGFPTTAGAFQTTYSGGLDDAFVTELNPTGTALVYSTYLGGTDFDYGFRIAVDAVGNACVTGFTDSADFPTTTGAFRTTYGGNDDAFVAKLNATGTALVYSTYLGGAGLDRGADIAVDASGDAYVTGTTSGGFPTTAGAFQRAFRGVYDAFVAKLNPTGTALVYSTYLGGTDNDQAFGIAVDTFGAAYVTGETHSTGFPTTPGAFQTSYGGGYDAFVTELNPTGTALVYSTYLGGTGDDVGRGIAVDGAGNAYVTGYTDSADFPTTAGAFQAAFGGGYDAFVTKLNATGTALVYSTYLGGTHWDEGWGIAVDAVGDAYVTGYTESTDFPTTTGAFQTTFGGGDAFVTKLNATGTALVYSTYLGGVGHDEGDHIAVDAAGNAYVTGFTSSPDFPTTPGAFQTSNRGYGDAFVAKFAFEVQTTTALTTSASPSTYGDLVAFTATVTAQGNPVTNGTVDFKEGDTVLASMVPLGAGGTASFRISTLSAVTHTITAYYSGALGLDASSGSGQQVVNPKVASVTPDPRSKVYGSADPVLTGSTSGFLPSDGVTASFSRAAGEAVAGSPYTISATLSPAGVLANYDITYNAAPFTITPAPLTVTPTAGQSMTYGGAVPTLSYTYTGLVNGDPAATFSGALATAATPSSDVGAYPITLGTLAATGNYTIGTFDAGTLTVTPAPLTVTANDTTKPYGSPMPPLSVTYCGFVLGQDPSVLGGALTFATTATASSHVQAGGYPITPGGLTSDNYSINYVPGTLTITADDKTKVYGAGLPALTASYSGFVNGDTPACLNPPVALSTTATVMSPVGPYPITASGAQDPDYTISFSPGTLTITKDGTTTSATASPAISNVGQSVTLTALVTANPPGAGTPTGSVDFLDSTTGKDLGSVPLSGGGASLTTSLLPMGSQTITLSYNGDGNFNPSSTTVVVSVGASILVLDPRMSGALSIEGNGVINIPGNLVVDSSSATALKASGNAKVTASSIQIVGGYSQTGKATISPTPITGITPVADPLACLAAPTGGKSRGSVDLSRGSQTIDPGIYGHITVSGKASLTMNPGVYIVAGGGFDVSGQASVTGTGVMIYSAGSNYPNPGGTFGSVSLSGDGSCQLSAPASDAYAGILIFQARDNAKALSFSGNAASDASGTIYAPAAAMTMSGNSNNPMPIIVDQLSVTGNGVVLHAVGPAGVPKKLQAAATRSAATSPAGSSSLMTGPLNADDPVLMQAAANGLAARLAPYGSAIARVDTLDRAPASVALLQDAIGSIDETHQGLSDQDDSLIAPSETAPLKGWDRFRGTMSRARGASLKAVDAILSRW